MPWCCRPPAERFAAFDTPDASRDLVMLADPARLIVGDTSATSTKLWFQLHATPRSTDRFACVLSVRGASTAARRYDQLWAYQPVRREVAAANG